MNTAYCVNTFCPYNKGVQFEWDEQKRRLNIKKHGLDFVDAHSLFAGPMLVRSDSRETYGEDRLLGIGLLEARTIVVIFVEFIEQDLYRIISMRKALKHERELFQRYFND